MAQKTGGKETGKADVGKLVSGCEQELAKKVDGKYFILENYLKEKKLTQFEDEVKKARAGFTSGKGTAAAAVRAENEINAIEARFVKWYESDEDVDDAPMFTTIISFLRETKVKLAVYRASVAALSLGNKQACLEAVAKAFEKYKAAAQKADSLSKDVNERLTDTMYTLMRYIDLDHEAKLVELMAPSGAKEGPVAHAIFRAESGCNHGILMNIRSHAFHARNPALQKAAAELLAASYEYQGALCAAYLFSEVTGD
ncbi:MAG: hypothetical protein WCX64_03455 [Candidatus Micrarchaeia archaeon]